MFPYGIFYAVEDDSVLVYAVVDLRRDPEFYLARRPNFTEEEIESSYRFYHGTWLVKESNKSR